jgi:hypothetical protein
MENNNNNNFLKLSCSGNFSIRDEKKGLGDPRANEWVRFQEKGVNSKKGKRTEIDNMIPKIIN